MANGTSKFAPQKTAGPDEALKRIEELTSKLNEAKEKKEDLNSKGLHLDTDKALAELNAKYRDALKSGDEAALLSMGAEVEKYHAHYVAEAEKQAATEKGRPAATKGVSEDLKEELSKLPGRINAFTILCDQLRIDFQTNVEKVSKELKPQIDEINRLGQSIIGDKEAIEAEVDKAHKNIKDRVEAAINANTRKAELSAEIKGMEDDLNAKQAALEQKKTAVEHAEDEHKKAFEAYDSARKAKKLSEPAIEREAKKPDAKVEPEMLDAVKLYRAVDEREIAARNAAKEMEAAEDQYHITQQRNKKISELSEERDKTQKGLDAYLSEKGKEFNASIEKIGKLASRMHATVNDERDRIDVLVPPVMSLREQSMKTQVGDVKIQYSDAAMRTLTDMTVSPTDVPEEYIPQKTGDAKAGKRAPIVEQLRLEEEAVAEALKGMPVILPDDLKKVPPPPPQPVPQAPVVQAPATAQPIAQPIAQPQPVAQPVQAVPPQAVAVQPQIQPPAPQAPAIITQQLSALARGAYTKICRAMAKEADGTEKPLADLQSAGVISDAERNAILTFEPAIQKVRRQGTIIQFIALPRILVLNVDGNALPAGMRVQYYKSLAQLERDLFELQSVHGEKPFGTSEKLRAEYEEMKKLMLDSNRILEKPINEVTRSEKSTVDKTMHGIVWRPVKYTNLNNALHRVNAKVAVTEGTAMHAVLTNLTNAMLATDDLATLSRHHIAVEAAIHDPKIIPDLRMGYVLQQMHITNEYVVKQAKAIAKAADKFNYGLSTADFIKLKKAVRDNPYGREAAVEYIRGSRVDHFLPLLPLEGEAYIIPVPKKGVADFMHEYDNMHVTAPLTKPQKKEVTRIAKIVDDLDFQKGWTRSTLTVRTSVDLLNEYNSANPSVQAVIKAYIDARRIRIEDAIALKRSTAPLTAAQEAEAVRISKIIDEDIAWRRTQVTTRITDELGRADAPVRAVIDIYLGSKRAAANKPDNVAKQFDDAQKLSGIIHAKSLGMKDAKAAIKYAMIADDIEFGRDFSFFTEFWPRSTVLAKSDVWLYKELGAIAMTQAPDVVLAYINDTGKARLNKRLKWRSGQLEPGPVSPVQASANNHAEAVKLDSEGHVHSLSTRIESALAKYNEAIAKDPNYARAWHNRMEALLLLGRTREALEALDNRDELNLWAANMSRRYKAIHETLSTVEASRAYLTNTINASALDSATKGRLVTKLDAIRDEAIALNQEANAALAAKDGPKLKEINEVRAGGLMSKYIFANIEYNNETAALRPRPAAPAPAPVAQIVVPAAPVTAAPAPAAAQATIDAPTIEKSITKLSADIIAAKDAGDLDPVAARKLADALKPPTARIAVMSKMDTSTLDAGGRKKIADELATLGASVNAIRDDFDKARKLPKAPITNELPDSRSLTAAQKASMAEYECNLCGFENFVTQAQEKVLNEWGCHECEEPMNTAKKKTPGPWETAPAQPAVQPQIAPTPVQPAPQPAVAIQPQVQAPLPRAGDRRLTITPAVVADPKENFHDVVDLQIDPLITEHNKLANEIDAAGRAGTISAENAADLLIRTNNLGKQLEESQGKARNGKNVETISTQDYPVMVNTYNKISQDFEAAKSAQKPPAAPRAVIQPQIRPQPQAPAPAPQPQTRLQPSAPAPTAQPQIRPQPVIPVMRKPAPVTAPTIGQLEKMVSDLGTKLGDMVSIDGIDQDALEKLVDAQAQLSGSLERAATQSDRKKAYDKYAELNAEADKLAKEAADEVR